MWPWGHLGVAYLAYVGLLRVRGRTDQPPAAVVAVGLGAALPDLVDKPLAWTFGVLPSGRSLAHSLLVAGVVLLVLRRVARRRGREDVVAGLAVGWLSHVLSDLGPETVLGLLAGDAAQLRWTTYLLWPLLPSPPYPNDDSFAAHFAALSAEPYVIAQFALFGLAAAVWVRSGTPGLSAALDPLRRA